MKIPKQRRATMKKRIISALLSATLLLTPCVFSVCGRDSKA